MKLILGSCNQIINKPLFVRMSQRSELDGDLKGIKPKLEISSTAITIGIHLNIVNVTVVNTKTRLN